jgi:tryptophan-rich sensory protein
MNDLQWTSLFTFLVAWWFDVFHLLGIRINVKGYYGLTYRIIPKPPLWVFSAVNNLVYPLTAVACHQYINWTTPNRSMFDAAMALFLASLILEKIWGPVFFRLRWLWGAMLVICMLFMTSVAGLIVVWVDTRSNGVSNYVAGGLYIPFVLWVVFRMFLNLDIAWNNGHVRFYYREDIVTTVPVHPSKMSQKAATITVYKSSSTTGNRVPYTSSGSAF